MKYQWLVTAGDPRRQASHAPSSITGWKVHAVRGEDHEKIADLNTRSALCGLFPKRGWAVDLFIEEKCKNCKATVDANS